MFINMVFLFEISVFFYYGMGIIVALSIIPLSTLYITYNKTSPYDILLGACCALGVFVDLLHIAGVMLMENFPKEINCFPFWKNYQ